MNEVDFWRIVAPCGAIDVSEQRECLRQSLSDLSDADLVSFTNLFEAFREGLYHQKIYLLGCLLHGSELSDDLFLHFSIWVVLQGKDIYSVVAETSNIDDVATRFGEDVKDFSGYESLYFDIFELYESRTGKSLYDQLEERDFDWPESPLPRPDTLVFRSLFPKLWMKYREHWSE
jgi:hypothetical protein